MSLAAVLAGRQLWDVEVCHVLDGLAQLPDGCVQTCITSPPYWGLRAYGTEPVVMGGAVDCAHAWQTERRRGISGGTASAKVQIKGEANFQIVPDREHATCTRCGAWHGELGSEPTPALWVAHMVAVLREVRRVLRKDGTLWLNIGDSYAGSGKGPTGWNGIGDQGGRQGFVDQRSPGPAKSLCLIPERLAIALQEDGWIVRSRIAWCKLAPMPESVIDRPTSAWEHIWLLAKQSRYFYDAEAVRSGIAESTIKAWQLRADGTSPYAINRTIGAVDTGRAEFSGNMVNGGRYSLNPAGANLRNWWPLAPEPFADAHFATFPTEIPRRAILAGTSAHGACAACGAPWRRTTVDEAIDYGMGSADTATHKAVAVNGNAKRRLRSPTGHTLSKVLARTTGWFPTCTCADPRPPVPQLVLDIFSGAGTTGLVARQLGRRYIGFELSEPYAEMSRKRIAEDAPMVEAIDDAEAAAYDQLALFD